jgi:hypothetical protein
MTIDKKRMQKIAMIIAGILFQGMQILVLLHFVLVDHHYNIQSEAAQFTVELDHPCLVRDYFNSNYPDENSPGYSTTIRKSEHFIVPEFQSCFSSYEVRLMRSRGPPPHLLAGF